MAKGLKNIQGFKLSNQNSAVANELFVSQEILREHNKPTYEKINEAFEYAQSVAVSQATGTGKSFLAIKWLADKLKDGQTALYLAPNENIANQFKKHIKILGLAEKLKNVKFVLYPSLQTEVDAMLESSTNVDYIIADEFHRLGATTWNPAYLELIENNPEALVLGLSATPVRYLDGERDMAEELFEESVEGINLVDAIKQGIIPTPNYVQGVISYSASLEQLEKRLKYVKDENSRNEINKEIKKLKRNIEQAGGLEELFGEYIVKKDGKYVLFCSDLNHLLEIKEKIENGLFSKVSSNVKVYDVSYKKTESQIEREIDKFEKDEGEELKIMLSVEILNEGVHIKGLDGAIMMRKTISPRIYLQQLGRVLAVGGKEKPLVIDVVENYESLEFLGSYFTDNEYESTGRGEEFVLPFEVKGRSVEIDKFIKNIEDLMYKSTGTHGWLALAREYCNQNGNLKVPLREKNGSYSRLYEWMRAKKIIYRKDPNDKKNKWIFDELSAIDPNWHKDRAPGNREQQEKKLQECMEYFEIHGNLEVPEEGGKNRLYYWISQIKNEYRKDPKNANKLWIFESLFAIDPNWYIFRGKGSIDLQKKFIEGCRQYFEKYGNLRMSAYQKDGTIVPYYQWLDSRKQEYRKNPENHKNKWIFDELSAMDPEWYKDRSKGNIEAQKRKLQECREFFNENGNLNIPKRNEDRTRSLLYQWVNTRKREYRKDPEYEKTKWIFDELSLMDPDWYKDRSSGNEHQQREKIEECREYFKKYGNLNVSANKDGSINPLYTWLTSRRKEFKKNPTTSKNQWIFDELSKIDPEWHRSLFADGNDHLQECQEYFKKNGNLNVSCVGEYSSLYDWLKPKKREYRKNPENPKNKNIFNELLKLDPYWYLSNKEYNAMLDEESEKE